MTNEQTALLLYHCLRRIELACTDIEDSLRKGASSEVESDAVLMPLHIFISELHEQIDILRGDS
jgi:hypothetical protein